MNLQKLRSRFMAWALILALILVLMPAYAQRALAAVDSAVPYIDEAGAICFKDDVQLLDQAYFDSPPYVLDDAGPGGGWFVASGDIDLGENTLTILGDVYLILADGCDFRVTGNYDQAGVSLIGTNHLTIYAQSDGPDMGSLSAIGNHGGAGIGGNYMQSGAGHVDVYPNGYADPQGGLVINGGAVTAQGGDGSAGIGGGGFGGSYGVGGWGGFVTINGGIIKATGGNGGAGIGGGNVFSGYSANEKIIIAGGTVNAQGGDGGAGIGGGYNGYGGEVAITGGTIIAIGNGDGKGIGDGGGPSRPGGQLLVDGDAIVFAGSTNADPADYQNGIVFIGSSGTVYGDVTLTDDLEIPSGSPPYTLTILPGATLTIPDGVTLTIPDDVIFVNDGAIYNNGTISGAVAGNQPVIPPAIITTALPNGRIRVAYDQTLTATGTAPIAWSHDDPLPDGLILSTDGALSGIPTVSGTFSISIRAKNNNDMFEDAKTLTLVIAAASANDYATPPANPGGSFSGDSVYTKNSGTGVIFIVEKAFSQFSSVSMGNSILTRDTQYTAAEGSTRITLIPAYLDTLNAGTYTLRVNFKDDAFATATFTIVETPPKTDVPSADTGLPVPFEDVKENDWFLSGVMYAYQNNLMTGSGTDPMLFSPNAAATRGLFATILYSLEGSPDAGGLSNPFDDVAEGMWYADAIKWSADKGIVAGIGGGKYAPDAPIKRQDMAVILLRYMNFKRIILPVTSQWIIFADEAAIADYAMEAIQTLNKLGIINGTGANAQGLTIVDPESSATRAQTATMLMNFLRKIEQE